jgi:hypothetical protein
MYRYRYAYKATTTNISEIYNGPGIIIVWVQSSIPLFYATKKKVKCYRQLKRRSKYQVKIGKFYPSYGTYTKPIS